MRQLRQNRAEMVGLQHLQADSNVAEMLPRLRRLKLAPAQRLTRSHCSRRWMRQLVNHYRYTSHKMDEKGRAIVKETVRPRSASSTMAPRAGPYRKSTTTTAATVAPSPRPAVTCAGV